MASKRRIRRNACDGKQQHASREKALEHVYQLRRKDGQRLSAYACKFGNHWHVGHPDKRRIIAIKARAAASR